VRKIDEITVGEKIHYQTSIDEKIHYDFMRLSGDVSPIHTDKKFAEANGHKDCLGYAFLLTSVLSKVYGTIFPGGSELCLKQECNFPSPYYIGDELRFTIEVLNKNEKLKLLTVMTTIENQDNMTIFRGQGVFQLSLTGKIPKQSKD